MNYHCQIDTILDPCTSTCGGVFHIVNEIVSMFTTHQFDRSITCICSMQISNLVPKKKHYFKVEYKN